MAAQCRQAHRDWPTRTSTTSAALDAKMKTVREQIAILIEQTTTHLFGKSAHRPGI
jgi:hypothetical protein